MARAMRDRKSYYVLVKPFGGSVSCSQDTLVMNDSSDEHLQERSETNQTKKETVGNPSLDIADVVKLVTIVLQTKFHSLSGQLKAEQCKSITKK